MICSDDLDHKHPFPGDLINLLSGDLFLSDNLFNQATYFLSGDLLNRATFLSGDLLIRRPFPPSKTEDWVTDPLSRLGNDGESTQPGSGLREYQLPMLPQFFANHGCGLQKSPDNPVA